MILCISMIMVYVICGFVNFGLIGILIGGFLIIELDCCIIFLEFVWKMLVVGMLVMCLLGVVVGVLLEILFFGS